MRKYGLLTTNVSVFVAYADNALSENTKISSEMKIMTKTYQQNLVCWPESMEIGISEHITFSLDSIENISHYKPRGKVDFTLQ